MRLISFLPLTGTNSGTRRVREHPAGGPNAGLDRPTSHATRVTHPAFGILAKAVMPRQRLEARMTARTRTRSPRTLSGLVLGAFVGATALGSTAGAAVHDAEYPNPPRVSAIARPEDRRIAVEHDLLEAALSRIRVWTPSETILPLSPQPVAPIPQIRELQFDIPPGPLGTAVATFETLTGIKVTLSEDGIRTLNTPGVTGLLTPEAALKALLRGTGVGYRFTAPDTVSLDVQVVSEAVDVSGALPRLASPRFSEPVRDTPQTITIVPQGVMQAQNATTLRDVLRNVPGITYQAGEGGGGLPGDSLTMRGFAATNDIFVDGVRDVGAYSRDAFNLEQVEVVKGPAGPYSGRGATGGSINMVTKTPMLGAAYNGTIGGGSSNYGRATVDLNQPVSALGDGTAVRLNAMWTSGDVPGRDVVENSTWAFAPTLAMGIGTKTRLTADYVHLTQDNVPDYGLPWAALDATPAIDQTNFYGLRNYDYEDIDNDVASVNFAQDFRGSMTLRNLARWGRTSRDSAITSPRPPNRQLQQRTMTNEMLANQTMLTSAFERAGMRHSVVTGIEFARETTDNRNRSQTTNQPQTDIFNPDPNQLPFGPMPPNTGNPSTAETGTIGAYVFDTVQLSDSWLLSGGLRVDRSEVDYTSTNLTNGVVTDLHSEDSAVTWNAGAVYKPRPQGSIYAGAATSFNPSADAGTTGTALSDVPTAANNVNLEPERTFNVEVGTKWDLFNQRLSLGAALFRTEKTNARTRNLTSDPFVLEGRHRVDGIELTVAGTLAPRWTVFGGYAHMNSRIVESANPDEVDNNLALTPNNSFSLWTQYEFSWGLGVGGGAQFADNVFRNTINTLSIPSYWLVNGMASYEINGHLTLRLNGNNLGDTAYVDRASGGHYIPGPGRSVVLTLDSKF
jgi:catecholate siderophore receptor